MDQSPISGKSLNVWGDIGYTLQNPAISASIPSLIPALGMYYFDICMLSIPYMALGHFLFTNSEFQL